MTWKAPNEVCEMLLKVKQKYHSNIKEINIAVCFDDSKLFIKNKLNLGKIVKFNDLSKLWIESYDLCLIIPSDLWVELLKDNSQREAYLDLQLSRCDKEYQPQEIKQNGKKIKIKDDLGRIQYTTEPKLDKNGNMKWIVSPLDIEVYTSNVSRYGLWYESLLELGSQIDKLQTSVNKES